VETLSAEWMHAYDEFLLSDERTLLYQSSRYMGFLQELLACEQRTLLVFDQNKRIVGALPLMSLNGPFGKVLNSLPYYGSNGGIVASDADVQQTLIAAYNEQTSGQDVAASTLIENPLFEIDYALVDEDLRDERIGQFTPIAHSQNHADALMEQFHYKTRNMVRKAEKLGIKVQVENDQMEFLAGVHEENMREIGGLAKTRNFFTLIPKHYRADKDYKIYVARLDGQPVAAMLVFYFNRTAEYYTPVVLKDFRDTQALSAVIHTAMSDASKAGFAWWNWGGTWLTQDGVYRFKSRWGTKDITYRYFIKVNNRDLLKATREELLTGYPSFFTVPFSALQG
jgi:hypothetical protein